MTERVNQFVLVTLFIIFISYFPILQCETITKIFSKNFASVPTKLLHNSMMKKFEPCAARLELSKTDFLNLWITNLKTRGLHRMHINIKNLTTYNLTEFDIMQSELQALKSDYYTRLVSIIETFDPLNMTLIRVQALIQDSYTLAETAKSITIFQYSSIAVLDQVSYFGYQIHNLGAYFGVTFICAVNFKPTIMFQLLSKTTSKTVLQEPQQLTNPSFEGNIVKLQMVKLDNNNILTVWQERPLKDIYGSKIMFLVYTINTQSASVPEVKWKSDALQQYELNFLVKTDDDIIIIASVRSNNDASTSRQIAVSYNYNVQVDLNITSASKPYLGLVLAERYGSGFFVGYTYRFESNDSSAFAFRIFNNSEGVISDNADDETLLALNVKRISGIRGPDNGYYLTFGTFPNFYDEEFQYIAKMLPKVSDKDPVDEDSSSICKRTSLVFLIVMCILLFI